MRGVSGDSPEGGARLGVPRLRLVTAGSGGAETARRALRPVLRGARCTHLRRQCPPSPRLWRACSLARRSFSEGGCRRRKRGPEAENRQGGAPRGARPSAEGRKAPRKRLACRVMCRPDGCRCTRAPVGAPSPLDRGGKKVHDPGANAPRERDVLCKLRCLKLRDRSSDFGRTLLPRLLDCGSGRLEGEDQLSRVLHEGVEDIPTLLFGS